MPVSSRTLLDAVNVIGFRVGNYKQKIDTLANPDLATINLIECINETIRKIFEVRALPYQNSRTVITTLGSYAEGTVALTNGSSTVTGTGTTWTSDMVGSVFAIQSLNSPYRISSVESTTSITLDANWSGESISGEGYVIAQDRYDLPSDFYDFIPTGLTIEGSSSATIDVKRPSELEYQRHTVRGIVLSTGRPNMATVYDRASSGNWQITFDPFPDQVYRISILYRARLTDLRLDNDILPTPDEQFGLVARGAVALWREYTGGPEMANNFKVWIRDELSFYASFDRRSTDEEPRMVPNDVMRETRTPSTSVLGL